MKLPAYFLVDLPPEATLSPLIIEQACETLKRNRRHYLAHRSTRSLIELICQVADNWLDRDDPFRQMALEQAPAQTGFSAATLEAGLDAFFGSVTPGALDELIVQDLGHVDRLDRLAGTEPELERRRRALAFGPEFLVHIAAGNLPNPIFLSMLTGLLLRSAQWVKCASGGACLPRLLAHSIYAVEPKAGACLEVVEWPGGNALLETPLFAQTDCVTATGGDQTLEALQRGLPPGVRFLGYGHRVSFGYVAADALSRRRAEHLAEQTAADVAAWDQQGCLSPHVIYVQAGGSITGVEFAALVADALERLEQVRPRGPLSESEAAAIVTRRQAYETRAAHSPDTQCWASADSTAWTVVYEADARFQCSCLNRFLYVKSARDLAEALHGAEEVRERVSTVGLAASDEVARRLVSELAAWGVSRVCPLGRMQSPPLTWRHDGRPALGELVRWTDWEGDSYER